MPGAFDKGKDNYTAYHHPSISILAQDFFQIGKKGAEILLGGETVSFEDSLQMPVTLIERESTNNNLYSNSSLKKPGKLYEKNRYN